MEPSIPGPDLVDDVKLTVLEYVSTPMILSQLDLAS
jgi:hypothetical protein